MSDRITSIRPRTRIEGVGGFASHGRETRASMITQYRRHYQRQLEQAQAALALTDDELIVTTYLGVWARRNEKEVTE